MSVALAARQRVHDLSAERAARPEAHGFFGLLRIKHTGPDGKPAISARQYEAGNEYVRTVLEYRKAILAPPVASGGDLDRHRGHDGSDGTDPRYVAWCEQVEIRYRGGRRALLEAPDPLAMMAVDAIVLEDRQAWSLVGSLRIGLNALTRYYFAG